MKWVSHVAITGLLVACGASASSTTGPQAPVPGTESHDGVTEQQAVSVERVVDLIAEARCDREQSCNRIGPGAQYRHREDCLREARRFVSTSINAQRCMGGIGEVGLNRCLESIEEGQCDSPEQVTGMTSHCHLSALCMKR